MFTIAEVIKILTRFFVKQNKRFPKGLEGVDIRLKAKKIHDVGKSQGYEGGISENQIKHFLAFEKQQKAAPYQVISGDSPEGKIITGKLTGKNVIKFPSGGVDEVHVTKQFTGKSFSADDHIKFIKSKEPIDAMKEANSVIGRKGRYKNVTHEEADRILKDTEDHIFQRDVVPDEFDPDYASGGLAHMLGEPTYADGGRTGYFTGALADTEQGKSMSPGTRYDYSPGQGHRETVANKQLAEIEKFHNLKAASMELKPPKRSIREKIGGGINRVLGNPLVRSYAAWGTGGLSEKLRSAMIAKRLHENRDILSDEAIEEEISNIPVLGGISPQFASGGIAGMLGEPTYSNGGEVKKKSFLEKIFGPTLKSQWATFTEKQKQYIRENHPDSVPEGQADGGRTGFKKGTKFDPKRRTVLKGIAALATLPVIGKYFKWAKPFSKTAARNISSQLMHSNARGMPENFALIVRKVLNEGKITKATKSSKTHIHPERKDIEVTVKGDNNEVHVAFETDAGTQGDYLWKKGETIPPSKKGSKSIRTADEFTEGETGYWGKPGYNEPYEDTLEEIISGTGNLDDFVGITKIKKAAGGIAGQLHLNEGGRVPMIFGGSPGLKAMWKMILKNISKGKDKPIQKFFPKTTVEDKKILEMGKTYDLPGAKEWSAKELEIKVEGIEHIIARLKADKKILARQAKNKAMKDEGLDFIMKKMEESMSDVYGPHLKKYTDIDKDILQMETIKKNLIMKDRKLHATGGRVSYTKGGIAGMLGE